MRYPLLLALLLLPACSNAPTALSIDVTTGQETGAFADAGVTSVTVTVTSLDGTVDDVAKDVSPDGGSFDFGDLASTEQVCVAAAGFTAQNEEVMSGQSLTGLLLSAVNSDIPVFIQQKGQWARPPNGLESSHVNGVAAVVGESDLLLTGGTAPSGAPTQNPLDVDGYDLFGLGGLATAPAFLATAPLTMVPFLPMATSSDTTSDVYVLLIDDGADATWLDYSELLAGESPYSSTQGPPAGLSSFADVAGGALVDGGDGTVYVVGAARSGPASNAVLEVDTDQTLVAHAIKAMRQGAATTFVSNVGLVVAGGNGNATGVEVPIIDGSGVGLVGTYPMDATVGAGAVTDGEGGFYLVGGTLNGGPAPTRHFVDLASCTSSSCMPVYLPAADIPVALTNVSAYQLAGSTPCATTATATATGRILVVGEGAAGTQSFVINLPTMSSPVTSVTAVPLREPRRGAVAIPVPTGALAILGGEHLDGGAALSIELFAP